MKPYWSVRYEFLVSMIEISVLLWDRISRKGRSWCMGEKTRGGAGKIHHRTSIYSMINIRRHEAWVHWLCVVCVGLLVVDKATIHCDVVKQCPEVRSQNRFRELHRLLCVGRCRKRQRQRKVTNVEPLCVYPPAGCVAKCSGAAWCGVCACV